MARAVDRRRVTEIAVSRVTDFGALEARWRDLEARSQPSFFQSWTWTGCLAAERFPDPVLVAATEAGRTVALALFNRRGRTLYLGESGDPALDCVYIEYNGVLAETGREAALTAACLRAAKAEAGRLVLSGVGAAAAEALDGVIQDRVSPAPFIDFTLADGDFLARRSANTRQQLRRSDRVYAALSIARAGTLARALEYLEGLRLLHQESWIARGKPGAFAEPFFGRFHHKLIARGLRRGEIDLLRVCSGDRAIGYLYNFRHRGRSLAYQSGFDPACAGKHGKPGLTCHHQAIQYARDWGAERYEFLAGEARYKRSLADAADTLYWIESTARFSPRFLARRARDYLAAWRA